MNNRFNKVEQMVLFSGAFTMLLLVVRVVFSGELMYMFYGWNFILAAIPLLVSRTLLRYNAVDSKTILLLLCWLIFLPNAPYIITDILHFTERPPVPKWYDMLLVTSAAWSGMMFGIISIMQVEEFLKRCYKSITVRLIVFTCFIVSAFGIYLGRFLRFNSWDVITDPASLVAALTDRLINPEDHLRTFSFTILFGLFISIIYYTMKELTSVKVMNDNV